MFSLSVFEKNSGVVPQAVAHDQVLHFGRPAAVGGKFLREDPTDAAGDSDTTCGRGYSRTGRGQPLVSSRLHPLSARIRVRVRRPVFTCGSLRKVQYPKILCK